MNADSEDGDSSNSAIAKIILFVIAIPFIPAVLFGVVFYWVFLRILKFRRSVSGLVALAISAIAYSLIRYFDSLDRAISAFTGSGGIAENWTEVLYLVGPLSLGLGAIIGYGIILWDVRDIKNNPHRVELPGFWTYKLKWRKTPLELWRKRKAIKSLKTGALIETNRAPLGYEEEKDRVAYRFAEESVYHTIVTGAAGSGKTISMLSMMRADIEAGRTVIAVDFKRSPEFAAKLAAWAHEFEIPFFHFEKGNPESYKTNYSLGQSTYDPFASGSGSEMVLNLREYDSNSAVYKEAMQQLLQIVFAMMEQADQSKAPNIDWSHGGIYQLASAITDPNLKDLLVACEGQAIFHEAQDYVPMATSGKGLEKETLEKLRGQMRTIVASAYGRWFKIGDGTRNIDLFKAMTGEQSVVLFSFNSEDEPELARYVGSMIFADMRACSGKIRNMKAEKITNVYVDEFQAVPPTAVNGLLEKARESKIAMTLAQQAFEQIITSSPSNGEAYLQSILVTCSNFLTHAGMTQDSAERVSKLLGKTPKTVYSRTNKSDGGFLKNNFSNRRSQIISASNQEVWKVEPAEFMELSAPSSVNGYKSTAILVNKSVADPNIQTTGTIARKLWMIPPQCVLEEYVPPHVGDEKDAKLKGLYSDQSTSLLSEEEILLQKSYQDNTPVYREDHEVLGDSFDSFGLSADSINDTIDAEQGVSEDQEELFREEAFSSLNNYDSDDEDGGFTLEEIDEFPKNGESSLQSPHGENSKRHEEVDFPSDLSAFDSLPPVKEQNFKQKRIESTPIVEEDLPLPKLGRKPSPRTVKKYSVDDSEEESLPEI